MTDTKADIVQFQISYLDTSYNCSRSEGHKGSLKKFCKNIVGRDLSFEFEGKTVTGLERVELFSGRVILAYSV